ncbi:MAG TPA: hypothetical protein VFB74_35840 [Kribbellaceae bacterium]|nr:hypothetical protein [Kribbellaceae bacterium]
MISLTTGAGPYTVGSLLIGNGGAAVPALTHRLATTEPVRALAAAARLWPNGLHAVAADVAKAAMCLFDTDLSGTLIAGWRTHDALISTARSTAASPGTVHRVSLDHHEVSATYRPYVELLVDGRPVGSVHFELRLALAVDGWLGVVSAGRLVAVEFARCGYTAALTCEGAPLVSVQGELDSAFTVKIGDGTRLIDPPSVKSPGRRPG